MKRIMPIFILLLFLFSCASTKMSSFKDPDFDEFVLHSILVCGYCGSIQQNRYIETLFVNEFKQQGIEILAGMDVFPPTRGYTSEEMVKIVRETGVDGILIIGLTDAWIDKKYIPPSYHTEGTFNKVGNSLNYSEQTTSVGGGTITKPRATYDITLLDAGSGKKVWIADAFSRGNAFADFNIMMNSLVVNTLNALIRDGLIIPLEPTEDLIDKEQEEER
ncbi:MAG: hypothetical protein JW786_11995 [Desulfobacterales bacterium]|nr:hypothetical protein [Desulfobacterales bacterium]